MHWKSAIKNCFKCFCLNRCIFKNKFTIFLWSSARSHSKFGPDPFSHFEVYWIYVDCSLISKSQRNFTFLFEFRRPCYTFEKGKKIEEQNRILFCLCHTQAIHISVHKNFQPIRPSRFGMLKDTYIRSSNTLYTLV